MATSSPYSTWPAKYLLIIAVLIVKFIIKVAAVAIAAPISPRQGISRIFSATFKIPQIPCIRNGICTFPMLARVDPTAMNGANMVLPRRRISNGTYARRKSSVNNTVMIY